MEREKILFNLPELSIRLQSLMLFEDTLVRGMHFHKEIELIYVNSGHIVCEVNGERICIKENQVLFINHQCFHQILYNGEVCRFTYLQIDIGNFIKEKLPPESQKFIPFLFFNCPNAYMIFDKNSDIADIFLRIQEEANCKKTCYEEYIKAYLSLLYAAMCRNSLILDVSNFRNNKQVRKLLPVLNYIETHFLNKFTLDDMCRELNINKFNLCKEIKRHFGYTFTEYVNLRRLSFAQDLLLNSDKNITEIALDSGFASVQYFNKCFKNYTSYSPKKYQKMYHIGI